MLPSPLTTPAAEVKTPEANLMGWETLRRSKLDVLMRIGTSTRDRARIQQTYEVARKTKSVLTALGSPDAGMFDGMLTTMEQVLEMMAE